MKKNLPTLIYFIAFIEGGVLLSLEILSGKACEPYYGNSLSVWALTLSLSLISLAAGYKIGGLLSERKKAESNVKFLLFLASIQTIFISLFYQKIYQLFLPLPLFLAITSSAVFLIFIPLSLLGAISPLLIQFMTLKSGSKSGSESGIIYGTSTLGGVAFVWWIAFYSIPQFGISKTYLMLGCTLFLLSLIASSINRKQEFDKKLIVFFILLLFSCAKDKKITIISGKISNYRNQPVSMVTVIPGNSYPFKDFKIKPDGKFEIEISRKYPSVFALKHKGKMIYFMNDSESLFIEADMNDFDNYSIDGNGYSGTLKQVMDVYKKNATDLVLAEGLLAKNMALTNGEIKDEHTKTLEYKADELTIKSKAYLKNTIDTIQNKILKLSLCQLLSFDEDYYFIWKIYTNTKFEQENLYSEGIKLLLDQQANKHLQTYLNIEELIGGKKGEGQRTEDGGRRTDGGRQMSAKDFDLRGKYVLINFWAGWCYYSLEEQRKLKNMVSGLPANLIILNIGIDKEKSEFEKNLILPNSNKIMNINEAQGWNSRMLHDCLFTYMPANILLDSQGKFIVKNIKGNELKDLLVLCK